MGFGDGWVSHPLVRMWIMQRQLKLLNPDDDSWRLDDETREVGRKGVAAARQALQASRRHDVAEAGDEDARPTAA
jgi:hypothetical protein